MSNKQAIFTTEELSLEVDKYFTDDQPIESRYSRRQAIRDGLLIEVGEIQYEYGLNIPIAISTTAWSVVVESGSDADEESEECRLRELLRCYRRVEMYRSETCMHFLVRAFRGYELRHVLLKAVVSPGDDGTSIVTTIKLVSED